VLVGCEAVVEVDIIVGEIVAECSTPGAVSKAAGSTVDFGPPPQPTAKIIRIRVAVEDINNRLNSINQLSFANLRLANRIDVCFPQFRQTSYSRELQDLRNH
jgi:hypothetical protein